MAHYSQSQGVPYEQQPPAYQASQGVPAYNPAYTQGPQYAPGYSQSQGVPQNPAYYYQQPPPTVHTRTTYVTQPAGGGTDAGDALCCGICLGCLLCCLSDSCK